MQFSDLNKIQKHLEQKVLSEIPAQDNVRRVVAKKTSANVETYVYDEYPNPIYYNRRGKDGGLADPDNVVMTSNHSNGSSVKITFENISEGVDTLMGMSLTDTIVEGKTENWSNPNGKWADRRDFITPTIEELQNSGDLRNAMIQTLRNAGLDVK